MSVRRNIISLASYSINLASYSNNTSSSASLCFLEDASSWWNLPLLSFRRTTASEMPSGPLARTLEMDFVMQPTPEHRTTPWTPNNPLNTNNAVAALSNVVLIVVVPADIVGAFGSLILNPIDVGPVDVEWNHRCTRSRDFPHVCWLIVVYRYCSDAVQWKQE